MMNPVAPTSLESLTRKAIDCYRAQFQNPPDFLVAAPGRVNLIGEHVDYNDGFVLPMAIERYVVIAFGSASGGPEPPGARLFSEGMNQLVELSAFGEAELRAVPAWGRFVTGVIAGFIRRGISVPGFNAAIVSNVPLGAGLSSSAALEVAAATMLESLTQTSLPLLEKALLCQTAEHEFVGMPCGIMDQFSSVFGQPDRLMLIDCQDHSLRLIPLNDPAVTVLLIDSRVSHTLSGSEYPQRRAQSAAALAKLGLTSYRDASLEQLVDQKHLLSEVEFRRARHVITEINRTTMMATAIEEQLWDRAGALMYESHLSMKDDYEITCDEVDALVAMAKAIGPESGVYGSRMTGGGFGGCTVSLVATELAPKIAQQIAKQYQEAYGIGVTVFSSRPAAGAHGLPVPVA